MPPHLLIALTPHESSNITVAHVLWNVHVKTAEVRYLSWSIHVGKSSRSFGSTVGSHWMVQTSFHRSSFDITARNEYSLRLFLSISIFQMYINTSIMQNFWLWRSSTLAVSAAIFWNTLVRVEVASDWLTRIYRSILAEQFSFKIEIWRAK